jgi:hypothetical protein
VTKCLVFKCYSKLCLYIALKGKFMLFLCQIFVGSWSQLGRDIKKRIWVGKSREWSSRNVGDCVLSQIGLLCSGRHQICLDTFRGHLVALETSERSSIDVQARSASNDRSTSKSAHIWDVQHIMQVDSLQDVLSWNTLWRLWKWRGIFEICK